MSSFSTPGGRLPSHSPSSLQRKRRCAVAVKDPRQREHGLEAQALVFGQPVEGRLLIKDLIESMAHDIIADDLSDAGQAGIDGVAANGVHVQVSSVAAEHGESVRAEDKAGTTATVAGIVQRALRHKVVPALPRLGTARRIPTAHTR